MTTEVDINLFTTYSVGILLPAVQLTWGPEELEIDWGSEWHLKNTWNSLGLDEQKRYFEFPLHQK